jgi:hypothetical protein
MYARLNAPIRPMGDREVFELLQNLRVRASNMKLDMTDAMEEYCGTGYEKNMGVMDKNRFRSTMGTLFAGMVSQQDLHAICQRWKAGHPDPDPAAPPDSYSQVKWKQFASEHPSSPRQPPRPHPCPTMCGNSRLLSPPLASYHLSPLACGTSHLAPGAPCSQSTSTTSRCPRRT